jgi:uncharacterized membrane protein
MSEPVEGPGAGTGMPGTDEPATAMGRSLIMARFPDQASAASAYQLLIQDEIDGMVEIDGVLVVSADAGGRLHLQKMTEHSTRNGLMWGIVGGVLAGVFLPVTVVGGAVALGVAGAAAGKARNLFERLMAEEELASVITPGTSGIVALVSAPDVARIVDELPAATMVRSEPVDEETADLIKTLSARSHAEAEAGPETPAGG